MTANRIIPGLSTTASKIIALLEGKAEGAEVTYEEITRATGRPKSGKGSWWACSQTARRNVFRKSGAVWAPFDNTKFKRLDNTARYQLTRSDLRTIGRKIRRTSERASTVDAAQLPDGERTKFLTTQACLGILTNAATPATLKRMEDAKAYEPGDYLKKLMG